MTVASLLKFWINFIGETGRTWDCVSNYGHYAIAWEHFCPPSTSASVERAFSQSGLCVRQHHARII